MWLCHREADVAQYVTSAEKGTSPISFATKVTCVGCVCEFVRVCVRSASQGEGLPRTADDLSSPVRPQWVCVFVCV